MARNRKRAKDRRNRRPAAGQGSRPGLATARAERELRDEQRPGFEHDDYDEAPEPLEHAAPDTELAEAQLAVGRPDDADGADDGVYALDEDDEIYEDELADQAEVPAGVRGRGARRGATAVSSEELATASSKAPAPRGGARLVNFVVGSWRELQRVQWPDRRQVMQATGVVIGFVIVAGLYLGLADTVATKLVNLILQ